MFHRIRAIVKALMFVTTPFGCMHSFTTGLRACFGLPFTERIEQAARVARIGELQGRRFS